MHHLAGEPASMFTICRRMLRVIAFYAVAIALAAPLTILTVRRIARLHPRLRTTVTIAAIAGSLLWLLFPFVLQVPSSEATRLVRAVLAPLWLYWTLLTILYSAVTFVVFLAWLPWCRKTSADRFARIPSAAFLVTVLVVTVIGIWQALVPVRVEHVTIGVRGLSASLDGYRIAQMSDLHVGFFTRPKRLQQFVRLAAAEKPDAIVLTGDMIDDDPHWIPKLDGAFRSTTVPVFGVLGNHEMYGDPAGVIAGMKRSAVRLLLNSGVRVGSGGESLWLAGITDFAAEQLTQHRDLRPDLAAALRGRRNGEPAILIAHQPKAFALARRARIPLTIAGHTHGGQFGVRPAGWSLAGVFLPYHMGLYREGASTLYVNTGTGHWVLPFRFGMTPEITIYTLKRAS